MTAALTTPARTAVLLLAAGLGVLLPWTDEALANAKAYSWSRWRVHDQTSTLVADHSAWDRVLRAYVHTLADGSTCVDYGAVDARDRTAIDAYLRALESFPVSDARRDEQLAFWINLYNALTLKVVLEAYPVDTIHNINISPGWLTTGPWGAKLITVEGVGLSLDDIENRILRPVWRDPRIHYVINCASVGCPNLAPRVYTAEKLEPQLDGAARAFINHPRGVTVVSGRLRVSSLYKWYSSDFGGSASRLLTHLRRYASGELLQALSGVNRIDEYEYDWSLNDCHAKFQ